MISIIVNTGLSLASKIQALKDSILLFTRVALLLLGLKACFLHVLTTNFISHSYAFTSSFFNSSMWKSKEFFVAALAALHIASLSTFPGKSFLKFACKCLTQNLCSALGIKSLKVSTNPYHKKYTNIH
ncbi:hypothetical protein ACJW30_07G113300 [Castanea mollissima]